MARARFYTVGKIKRINGEYVMETLPNKGLYANGIYPTKLTLDDLTPDFIELFKGRRVCFMKASGVKDLLYSPNYFVDNHLFKDDFLYISYDKKIQEKADKSFLGRYEGYDEIIWGWSIVSFVNAVSEYSKIDVSNILAEISKKKRWYVLHNPTHHEIPNSEIDFEVKVHLIFRDINIEGIQVPHQLQEGKMVEYCNKHNLIPIKTDIVQSSTTDSKMIAQRLLDLKNECGDDYFIFLYCSTINDKDYDFIRGIWQELRSEDITYDDIYIRIEDVKGEE